MRPNSTKIVQTYFNAQHKNLCDFYTDAPEFSGSTPDALKSHKLFSLLDNRWHFRQNCRKIGLKVPDGHYGNSFAEISAWAVTHNRFPLIIKSAQNGADSDSVFLLKAFRELPQFYDEIKTLYPDAGVIIENFVAAKARIEITWLNGKMVLASQTGLSRSVYLYHSWRSFPVILPAKFMKQIEAIAQKFESLISLKNIPFRFSFCLADSGVTLISINAGLNRPEYFNRWNPAPVFCSEAESPASAKFFKLHFYNIGEEFDAQRIQKIGGTSLKAYDATEESAILLLAANDLQNLKTVSEQITTQVSDWGTQQVLPEQAQED